MTERPLHRTCLSCHVALGVNETVEQLPIDRRLAFDSARGRLWVICGRCGTWNLTPIETRWEAIECCERLYRATTERYSTPQIGIALVRGGLPLVRRPARVAGVQLRRGRPKQLTCSIPR